MFLGSVMSYNSKINQYRVNYDDGDSEDLELTDLLEVRWEEPTEKQEEKKLEEEASPPKAPSGSGHWTKDESGKRVWVASMDVPIPAKEPAAEELPRRADPSQKESGEDAQSPAKEKPLDKPAPEAGRQVKPAAKPAVTKPTESPPEEDDPLTQKRPRGRPRTKNPEAAVVLPSELASAAKRGAEPAAAQPAKKDTEKGEVKGKGKAGTAVTVADKAGGGRVGEQEVLHHPSPCTAYMCSQGGSLTSTCHTRAWTESPGI